MAVVRKVIARAHDDEPLERVMLQVQNNVAYLAKPAQLDAVMTGEKRPVPVPIEDVFLFDEEIYAELIEQYAGQGSTDPETWRQLRPY